MGMFGFAGIVYARRCNAPVCGVVGVGEEAQRAESAVVGVPESTAEAGELGVQSPLHQPTAVWIFYFFYILYEYTFMLVKVVCDVHGALTMKE